VGPAFKQPRVQAILSGWAVRPPAPWIWASCVSGANLLYLLAEHAGINARIVVPEEWRDPVADSADEPEVTG